MIRESEEINQNNFGNFKALFVSIEEERRRRVNL